MFPPSPPPFFPSRIYLISNEGVFFDTFSVNVSHMKGGAAGVQEGKTERKKHTNRSIDTTETLPLFLNYYLFSFLFFAALEALNVNVRFIDNDTVGISFGESITREDTVALLAG